MVIPKVHLTGLHSIASDALALPVQSSAFGTSTALKRRLEELVQVMDLLRRERRSVCSTMFRTLPVCILVLTVLCLSVLKQPWLLHGVDQALHHCAPPLPHCSWPWTTRAQTELARPTAQTKGRMVL